ncbi:four-carbon acid sugar kinase family protein [Methylobacterium sp. WL8]|uniref:four-carbon acid sugar kinase family protein n=1 Tax=Methylobacterium sp. WL8 TaxID=2603899 RepID=UPI0011C88A5C|nr:four-carbon acid sugar kinase family protein [Methylobacterium sp. WL8]TXN82314.1 four-carbon acid sugar kinase family protein [Methylobacterium sp. WL8]
MADRWLILADDLTGAADCAIAFGRRGRAAAVSWGTATQGTGTGFGSADLPVLSYDADSRSLSAAAAAQRHAQCLRRLHDPDRILFKKIDSTLRGQPAAETAAAIHHLKGRTEAGRAGTVFGICAPAFPAAGRTTVGGRVHVDGRPLEDAEVWTRDHSYVNADLAFMLGTAGVATKAVPLAMVRGPGFASQLEQIAAAGDVVAICDAETQEDLDCIAAAGLRIAAAGLSSFFVGSAGLAHALAAVEASPPLAPLRIAPHRGGSLIVVGSLAAASRAATRKLAALDGVVHLPVPSETLLRDPGDLAASLAHVEIAIAAGHDVLVEIAMEGVPDMALGPRLVQTLADALAPLGSGIGAFAATGGETASALLSRFGVEGIRLVDEIEPGVSLGLTLGRLAIPVATKAGAFGDADSLIRIRERLRAVRIEGSFS